MARGRTLRKCSQRPVLTSSSKWSSSTWHSTPGWNISGQSWCWHGTSRLYFPNAVWPPFAQRRGRYCGVAVPGRARAHGRGRGADCDSGDAEAALPLKGGNGSYAERLSDGEGDREDADVTVADAHGFVRAVAAE